MTERWLTYGEAVEIVRARVGGSVGYANSLLQNARASGEVRHRKNDVVLLVADDGVVGMNLRRTVAGVTIDGKPVRHSPTREVDSVEFSEDDLIDWLERNHPTSASPGAPKPRQRGRRDRAGQAIEALWPQGLPDEAALPNMALVKKIAEWISADCRAHNQPPSIPSNDTMLRAAGRK